MKDEELAETFLRDHLLAASALMALQLRHVPEVVRLRLMDAVTSGTGVVELRTRIEAGSVEVVLVPADGSEPLPLTRMAKRGNEK